MKVFIRHIGLLLFFVSTLLQGQGDLLNRTVPFQNKLDRQFQLDQIDSIYIICHDLIGQSKKASEKALLYLYLGEAYNLEGKIEQCKDALKSAYDWADESGDLEMKSLAALKVGIFQKYYGTAEMGDQFIEEAGEIAKNRKYWKILFGLYQYQALEAIGLSDHDSGMQSWRSALDAALAMNDYEKIIETYNQISSSYYSLGKLDSAILFSKVLIDKKRAVKDESGLIENLSSLGMMYIDKVEFQAAQTQFFEALRIAEKQKDTIFIIDQSTHISEVFMALTNWSDALFYADKAIDLAKQKQTILPQAQNLKNKGEIYQNLDSVQLAFSAYQEALQRYQSIHHIINVADVQMRIGALFQSQQNYDDARRYLHQAIEQRQGADDVLGNIDARLVLGALEIEVEQEEKALEVLEVALEMAQKARNNYRLREVYRLMSQANDGLGNHSAAFHFLTQFNVLNDAIVTKENAEAISDLKLEYERDKLVTEKELEISQQLGELRKRKSQVAILVAVIIMMVLLLAFFNFINHKNKQLQQQKLEKLREEQKKPKITFGDGRRGKRASEISSRPPRRTGNFARYG